MVAIVNAEFNAIDLQALGSKNQEVSGRPSGS
jgi:hypothetical protein